MLVKSFVNNIIDISYNLNKYTQCKPGYKHIWKLFEVVCFHQHSAIAVYRFDGNEKLLICVS